VIENGWIINKNIIGELMVEPMSGKILE